LAVKAKEDLVSYIDEKVIEEKIHASEEEFPDQLADAVVSFDDSQDLAVTDPDLLKGTPYEVVPPSLGGDWSAYLGGSLQ
jgi:hypothetical protein